MSQSTSSSLSFIGMTEEGLNPLFSDSYETDRKSIKISVDGYNWVLPKSLLQKHANYFKDDAESSFDLDSLIRHDDFKNFVSFMYTGHWRLSQPANDNSPLTIPIASAVVAGEVGEILEATEYHDYAITHIFRSICTERKRLDPWMVKVCSDGYSSKARDLLKDIIICYWNAGNNIIDSTDPGWDNFLCDNPGFRRRFLAKVGLSHANGNMQPLLLEDYLLKTPKSPSTSTTPGIKEDDDMQGME